MTLIEFFRKLGRNLMPPGNRGSYDSEWEQPNRAGSGRLQQSARG
jgi:hypothetical protein